MVEFDELDEDDVRNQIVTISNELRAVRDHSTLVLEGATRILLDLIRKVEPFNEEPLSETVDEVVSGLTESRGQAGFATGVAQGAGDSGRERRFSHPVSPLGRRESRFGFRLARTP